MINFLRNIDYSLFHLINHSIANPYLDQFCSIIRDPNTWIPVYIILGIYSLIKFKKKAWIYIASVVVAFALSDLIAYQFLKPLFARLRPCYNDLMHAHLVLSNCGGNWGFPSSHASNHMAMALTIILTGFFSSRWVNAAWIGWPLLIGFAQVYVGVHYPADIAAGFLFGGLVALFNYYAIFPLFMKIHSLLPGNK